MKSPMEIAAWNLFVPGAGYMMVGRKALGAFVLISCLVAVYVVLEVGNESAIGWILMCSVVGAIDGYIQGAKKRDAAREAK